MFYPMSTQNTCIFIYTGDNEIANTTPSIVIPAITTSSDEHNIAESTTIPTATSVTIPITAVTDESTIVTTARPTSSSISYTTTSPGSISYITTSPSSIPYATASLSSSMLYSSSTSMMLSSSAVIPAPTSAVTPDVSTSGKLSTKLEGPTKEPSDKDNRLCGNANCSKSKVAGLVVACALVAVLLAIVILVVVKKSWDRHRHKKYRKIDYLIDGMYS